ncbi:MAG: D-alanyl-D-alanine carboxypeptidase/D-alanyl-D-alanine-endopeptidase [Pyrinomonadaceae bacterium]|nr:D-alanyl-D-alanine carboxypeptidase/D-alanyl-D-alanine-endopeptidase [Pyrinomonadaceae bacterium]
MIRIPKLTRRLFINCALAILIVVVAVESLKPLHIDAFSETGNKQPNSPSSSVVSKTSDSNQFPTSLSQSIDSAIDQSELASARWGVSVVSLTTGREVYGRHSGELFIPASNMKIYTTGVALDLLGANYRWRTSAYATTQPDASGTINGDLILYGRGAPDLIAQAGKDSTDGSLTQLAEDLYQRGIREVSGNVIGDESYFRGETLGDGWPWTDLQWYFGAEASALTVNANAVELSILPPTKTNEPPLVSVNDPDKYVSIQNSLTVVKRGERMTIGIHRGLSDNQVRVWGEFPQGGRGFGARLSVHNPSLWAARLFLKALRDRGIKVKGTTETRDSRVPPSERFNPSAATELAFVSSRTLGDIVKDTNKFSINLYAELLLRTIGRERGNMVSTPDPSGRERGDDEAGLEVIRLWLSRAGISTTGMALHDGSGLSRLNLVTPESISRLLVSLSKTAADPVFRASLPISGRDGTMGGRLEKLGDQVVAKTGSLTYTTSLSGYVTTSRGEVMAFSILCNDLTARASATRVIDQIVSLLAGDPATRG